jgi:hypothetical protein
MSTVSRYSANLKFTILSTFSLLFLFWKNKRFMTATNTHAKIEELLDAMFSMRSQSYQIIFSERKVGWLVRDSTPELCWVSYIIWGIFDIHLGRRPVLRAPPMLERIVMFLLRVFHRCVLIQFLEQAKRQKISECQQSGLLFNTLLQFCLAVWRWLFVDEYGQPRISHLPNMATT